MKPLPDHVPSRVIIEGVSPEVDGGRFPAKRSVGEDVTVEADIHCDGHEVLAAVVRYRHTTHDRSRSGDWAEIPMTPLVNDRWTASFAAAELGWYEFTIEAWIDRFATWRRDLTKRVDAGQDVHSDLLEGAALVRGAAKRVGGRDGEWLRGRADAIERGEPPDRVQAALDPALEAAMARHDDRRFGHAYGRVLRVWIDRERARFGTWYELFPRSTADEPGRHGTFRDVEKRLPYVAEMGFDVLYLPPIHPIGRAYRKGPNNTLTPGPDDPGSPWAIGGPEGGHKAIHPELGTFEDFDRLLAAAKGHGIEIALDVAFQCSPDHPYVKEHPEWFKHRPDGTIKYAENPPKKYQDIYPLDFECADWKNLWDELLSVVLFWADRGVRIFRVDNPHTKPFRFWEWLIANVQEKYPDCVFLSEAFTRPKVMKYLAKSGFTQSYTYFTWRNSKWELTEYFTELTQTPVRDYMRPNLFANTPDILPEYLQFSGPAGFRIRLVLAATLGATYGIYGPPFENFEATPIQPGKEEYLDSEKYQLRRWDWDRPNVFRELIALVNKARRENPALQFDHRLRFYPVDNDDLLFYGKSTPDLSNVVLTVVNLDPSHVQSGWVRVPVAEFGLEPHDSYQVQDLITGARYLWHGEANYVSLDPSALPAHILRLRRKARTEQDFDYFM
ncbi:MAG TPA: alpha-1,4-glucan--maltose-1-phosphate maltosyltransferase [Planctomycetaceae bacterium]